MKHDKRRLTRDGRIRVVFFLVGLLLLTLPGLTAAQESKASQTPPDAVAGFEVYYEIGCDGCHGAGGAGDGEGIGQLPVAPPNFTDPDYRKTAVPRELFDAITNGNMESLMPPFGPTSPMAIEEDGRWDLVASVYSFATPNEAVANGQAVYEEACAACHGETGAGDGPEAADFDPAPTNLADPAYWVDLSNEMVFASLESSAQESDAIDGHEYSLSDDVLWDAVDYARTFSYRYFNPNAPAEPIQAALISGQVSNGSTGEIVTDGSVRLRAFSPEIEQMLVMTTTIDADGRFQFDVTEVSPDWVYMTNTEYEGLNFSSDVAQINPAQPELDLPLTVFDLTDDPAVVNIEQVHMVVDFFGDRMQVTELYIFNNGDTAVFVGETGNPDEGTVKVYVPDAAENLNFQRAFSAMESFVPANEVIPTADGWADTIPLRPGRSNASLVVTYDLPYEDGLDLVHDLAYDTNSATVILPEAGVTVEGEGWLSQGTQETAGGAFLSYMQTSLGAGDALAIALEGSPEFPETPPSGSAGNVIDPRNQTAEIIIGVAAFLMVALGAVYVVINRRSPNDEEDYEYDEDEVVEDGRDIDALLQRLADLDDAFENGQIEEKQYQQQRSQLKAELALIWPRD